MNINYTHLLRKKNKKVSIICNQIFIFIANLLFYTVVSKIERKREKGKIQMIISAEILVAVHTHTHTHTHTHMYKSNR